MKPGTESSFDIDFKLLSPELKLKLWVLGLDADTSKVNIAYRAGAFKTSMGYDYGGNVTAALSLRRFSTKIGVNPGSGDVDLSLVFRGFKFGASASGNRRSFKANLAYGATLLPFPQELSNVFNSGGKGSQSLAKDIRSLSRNPMKFYKTHSNDVDVIKKSVKMGQQLAKQGKSSERFGAGLRLSFTPQSGLTIYGGVRLTF